MRLLAWLLVPLCLACAGPFSQFGMTEVKIVSSLPLIGGSSTKSEAIANGVRMALEERDGKAGRFWVTYEVLDDSTPEQGGWDERRELENANRIVADPSVVASIGPLDSGAARVSIPVLNRAGILLMSPANTYAGLTKPGRGEPGEPEMYYPSGIRNYARVVPADDIVGVVAAKWSKQMAARVVYVVDDGSVYGRGQALVFHQEAARRDLRVLPADGPESLDRAVSDFRELATRVEAAGPSLVFFAGASSFNAGQLWRDLRSALGPSVKLMGGDGIFTQPFLTAADEAALDTYLVFAGLPPRNYAGKAAQWAERYRVRHGRDPEPFAINGYEAANVVLDAIASAGRPDRAAIRDAALATRDYNGVLGRWSLDRNGDTNLTTVSIMQVKGPTLESVQFLTTLNAD
jgi:branched-chain amino acid transport system substrate-binding protein